MAASEFLSSIIEKMTRSLHVEMAFGQPIETHNRTIIPVARLVYGFGGGSNQKEIPRKKTESATESSDAGKPTFAEDNGGGGGGGNTTPIGVFEIADNHTRFLPVFTFKDVIAVITALTLILKLVVLKRK